MSLGISDISPAVMVTVGKGGLRLKVRFFMLLLAVILATLVHTKVLEYFSCGGLNSVWDHAIMHLCHCLYKIYYSVHMI